MVAHGSAGPTGKGGSQVDVAALIPLVRRIVAARVADAATADDLVQETLARILAAAARVEPGVLEPYAIVTARNVIANLWRQQDRDRRNQHRIVDLRLADSADEELLADEERSAVARALGRLSERERETLLAHEVAGQDTRSLAGELGSTAGAVAAQLNRTRARLRVEYLLARDSIEPPTARCRPVLLALSGGDRRRQREVDAARHLLECDICARLSEPLMERGTARDDEICIPIKSDGDIVAARQAARELLLGDVLARSLFEKYQRDFGLLNRGLDAYERPPTGSPTLWPSPSSTSASGSSASSRTPSVSCRCPSCRSASAG